MAPDMTITTDRSDSDFSSPRNLSKFLTPSPSVNYLQHSLFYQLHEFITFLSIFEKMVEDPAYFYTQRV